MPGLLDPTNLYPDFLDPTGKGMFDTPEYRRARVFDTLGGIGAALLAAGSQPGADFGSSLAAGLAGGVQAGRGAEDRFLKRAMVGSQVAKNRQEMQNDKAWREMFSGAATPSAAPTAAAAPSVASMPVSPGGAPSPDREQFIATMMPLALQVSQVTGLDPRLVVAQAALETGYGASAPGNNFFGIKSHDRPGGQTLATQEAGPGGMVPTQASFRTYADPAESARDYAEFLKTNSRYQPVMAAQGLDAQIEAMGKSGYATDPNYGAKLRQIAMSLPGGAPQVAQGDALGNPIQQAQYTPPQQAFRPQTMQEVVQSIPPGVRQMIGAMGRKEGMGVLMKYADPGSEAVIDTQSGQVVFIPKTMVGRDPRYQPVQGEQLNIERRRIQLEAANKPVSEAGVVQEPYVQAQERISRAQGTDPSSKITIELAQDAIKRSNEWQAAGLKAQSAIGRLGALQSMLDQITTGTFAGTVNDIKAAAKGAGIDLEAMGITDKVGVTQAAQALTNLMALENRDPSSGAGMPGAMSDADRAYLQQATVSITKDPAGNKLLIGIKKGDLQRQIDIAKYASEYKRSKAFKEDPAGLDDYVASKIASKNYYDQSLLQPQKKATDDYLTNLPPPPAGFSVPGQAAPSGGPPAPPAGFRIVK